MNKKLGRSKSPKEENNETIPPKPSSPLMDPRIGRVVPLISEEKSPDSEDEEIEFLRKIKLNTERKVQDRKMERILNFLELADNVKYIKEQLRRKKCKNLQLEESGQVLFVKPVDGTKLPSLYNQISFKEGPSRKVIKTKSILKNKENPDTKYKNSVLRTSILTDEPKEKSIKIDSNALKSKEQRESKHGSILLSNQFSMQANQLTMQTSPPLFNHDLFNKRLEEQRTEMPGESQLNKLLVKKIEIARGVSYKDNFGHYLSNLEPDIDKESMASDTSIRLTRKQYYEYIERHGRVIRRGPSPEDYSVLDDKSLPPINLERKKIPRPQTSDKL